MVVLDSFLGFVGDYQFDVYRMMRDLTGGTWDKFYPMTNVMVSTSSFCYFRMLTYSFEVVALLASKATIFEGS